jgi:hypothetical protein
MVGGAFCHPFPRSAMPGEGSSRREARTLWGAAQQLVPRRPCSVGTRQVQVERQASVSL